MKHLAEIGMTWTEHFIRANKFTILYSSGAVKSFIHSVYPDIYTTSVTTTHEKIGKILQNCEETRGSGIPDDKYNNRED